MSSKRKVRLPDTPKRKYEEPLKVLVINLSEEEKAKVHETMERVVYGPDTLGEVGNAGTFLRRAIDESLGVDSERLLRIATPPTSAELLRRIEANIIRPGEVIMSGEMEHPLNSMTDEEIIDSVKSVPESLGVATMPLDYGHEEWLNNHDAIRRHISKKPSIVQFIRQQCRKILYYFKAT